MWLCCGGLPNDLAGRCFIVSWSALDGVERAPTVRGDEGLWGNEGQDGRSSTEDPRSSIG